MVTTITLYYAYVCLRPLVRFPIFNWFPYFGLFY